MQFADRRVPWKIANSAENLVLQALQFQQTGICRKFPGGTSISHYGSNEYFVESYLMLVLNNLLLNRKYVVINALKALTFDHLNR
jgi:hypothetical protein